MVLDNALTSKMYVQHLHDGTESKHESFRGMETGIKGYYVFSSVVNGS